MKDLYLKAETLTEALPYIKRTSGRTVVIKYGGAAMTDPELRDARGERHRADEARRDQPRHRARRRAGDHVVHGAARPAGRVLQRPARHHRRGDGSRQDGACRQGEPRARRRHQPARAAWPWASRATTATWSRRNREGPAAGPRGRGHRDRHDGHRQPHRGRVHPCRRDGGGRRRRRQLQRQRRPRRG